MPEPDEPAVAALVVGNKYPQLFHSLDQQGSATDTGVDAANRRQDDVREHACQSSQNHPGLVLKFLQNDNSYILLFLLPDRVDLR